LETAEVRVTFLGALLFVSGAALAAPDENVLEQGHCPREKIGNPECIVDLNSRWDELYAARGVRKAENPRELKRAAAESDLGLDSYLANHRNTGLLVLKDGAILAERYQYGRTDKHRFASHSMAKTVVAMLVGIAVSEKHISSIDDRADKYLPALKGHAYGQTSIRHLLTMSSGIAWDQRYVKGAENYALIDNTILQKTQGGVDAVMAFNRREVPAGTRFNYADGDSEVLSLVLRAAVKVPLATYLSEKIWRPMGAEANATWIVDKGGYETGYCCLNATLRDYARFGLLLANYGVLDGKEIIPSEWVRAATRPEQLYLRVGAATTFNGYGYQTWLTSRDHARFAAFGVHGQAIFVDPALKLVVVHTAVWADANDRAERGAQFKLWQHLLEKLSS
jgi:CubicO group peptidase (beta-lactamase class C family)